MAQTASLLRVKTTLGERYYPLDTKFYSNIAKGVYFHKFGPDLSQGEMILWHNQSIETTLEEVEPILQESPRYRAAQATVYATNSLGTKVPRLRIELIRATAPLVNISDDLEKKIMREGDDFSSEEYKKMTDFLYEKMQNIKEEDDALSRSKTQIRQYLQGETLAPISKDLFYSMHFATGSPVFENWLFDSKAFWNDYKFYTVLRRGIMNYLSRTKSELRERTQGGEITKGEGIDLSLEIDLVLRQFMEKINEDYSLARVIDAERINLNKKELAERKHERKLADGAYTGKPLQAMSEVNLEEILGEWKFFDGLLGYVFEDLYEKSEMGNGIFGELKKYLEEQEIGEAIFYSGVLAGIVAKTAINLGLIAKEYIYPVGFTSHKYTEGIVAQVDKAAEKLAFEVTSGELDRNMGLPDLTIYRCFEVLGRANNSVPLLFVELINTHKSLRRSEDPLDRKVKRDLEHSYKNMTMSLQTKYGWHTFQERCFFRKNALSSINFYYWKKQQQLNETQINPPSLFEEAKEIFAQVKRNPLRAFEIPMVSAILKKHPEANFTKQECTDMLEKYGLSSLSRFIDEGNFVTEPAL